MNNSHEQMMKLYDDLNINEKRNEFSSLLEKTNQLIGELLKMEQIESDLTIKNYNALDDAIMNESQAFTFFYEDLWNIKNRLLSFLILKSSKNDGENY